MFPKLYNKNETDFLHNGLGLLSDAIKVVAREEINGLFELKMEYDSEGFLVDYIQEEMIIKAKANDKQDEQLFRIYSITKNHENDNLIIDAQHITYDLSNNFIEELPAERMTKKQVMELIGSSTIYPHPFNVTSSNVTTRSSTSLYRTNPLQMIAGMEGSVLQIWGGQIERDNFNLIMHDRRGSDDGVLVTYKKNLTGLTAKFDISNLVTRIFPFKYIPATDDEPEQLITVPGGYIDSPHIDDYEMPYIMPLDLSHEMDIETSDDLLNASQNWFVETGRDRPKVEMEVKFEHLWETEEYKDLAALELVGMGDTITVKHSKLKVEGTSIVNCIEYDVLAQKNIAVDVGNVKVYFTDKVNDVSNIVDKVDELESSTNQALKTTNGKNTIYYGPDEPTGNHTEGDLWFRVVDGEYTRTYRYDGIQWQLIMSKDIADIEETANTAKNRANESVEKAELASRNATEAIERSQGAFDKAQESLEGLDTLVSITDAQGEELTTIKVGIEGLQASVTDAEDNIATLQLASDSFATRIENAEGNISSISQTADGLQRRMSDAEGNIASVTELATGMQTRLTDAEGNINTLTQTASSLESTITGVRDDLDGLEIGGRNYTLNTKDERSFRSHYILYDLSDDVVDLENEPTKATFYARHEEGDDPVTLFAYFRDSGRVGERSTFTGNITSEYRKYEVSLEAVDDLTSALTFALNSGVNTTTVFIKKLKIERGNKSTDWTPAPEDVQSQITQLADNINLRVEIGDVINQINISDEEILISGNRLILDGDTTVTGTFRVSNANITSVDAGKMTTGTLNAGLVNVININADNIASGTLQAIDIYGVTIRGSTIYVDGDRPDFLYSNAIDTNPNTQGTHIYIRPTADGEVRATVTGTRTNYVPMRARMFMAPPNSFAHITTDNELRVQTASISGIYRDVRAEVFHGTAFVTRTTNAYIGTDSELRVVNKGVTDIYRDVRANVFRGTAIRLSEASNGVHFYVSPANDGEVRFTGRTNDSNYRPVRSGTLNVQGYIYATGNIMGGNNAVHGADSGYAVVRAGDTSSYVYLQSDTEVRATRIASGNSYVPVRADSFPTGSSEKIKQDITRYKDSALDLLRDSVIYKYTRTSSQVTELGFIIEREMPDIVKYDEESVNGYTHRSLNTKAIQELDEKVDLTREELVMKIARLESKINKLESAA